MKMKATTPGGIVVKPYSKLGVAKTQKATPPSQADQSGPVSKSAIIASVSALISAGCALPAGIYATKQIADINQAATEARQQLAQAKEQNAIARQSLTEARSLVASTDEMARNTRLVAAATTQQANGMQSLVGKAGDQAEAARRAAEEASRLNRTQEDQLRMAKSEQVPLIYPTAFSSSTPTAGSSLTWNYKLVSRNGRMPDAVSIWTRSDVVPNKIYSPKFEKCGSPEFESIYFKEGEFRSTPRRVLSADEVTNIEQGRSLAVFWGMACFQWEGKWAAAQICAGRGARGEIINCRPGGGSIPH